MDEHRSRSGESSDPTSRGWLLEKCPACGAEALLAVLDVDEPNFLCEACGRCWHVELGYVSRVDPATCMGCQHRQECMARLAVDNSIPRVK